ncbi:MAG: hypothetical protein U5K71_02915 [Gracilimonas sp.]|nr:hypothetical protein [Gracilimonas sp.]
MKVCTETDEMHQPMSEHAEDCPMNDVIPAHDKNEMKHHDLHDFGFACACSVEEAPVKTEANAQLKVKVPALSIVEILAEIHIDQPETNAFHIPVSDSYSPPPIYHYQRIFSDLGIGVVV